MTCLRSSAAVCLVTAVWSVAGVVSAVADRAPGCGAAVAHDCCCAPPAEALPAPRPLACAHCCAAGAVETAAAGRDAGARAVEPSGPEATADDRGRPTVCLCLGHRLPVSTPGASPRYEPLGAFVTCPAPLPVRPAFRSRAAFRGGEDARAADLSAFLCRWLC